MALKKKALGPNDLTERAARAVAQAEQDLAQAVLLADERAQQYQDTADLYLSRASVSRKQGDKAESFLHALSAVTTP